MPSTAAIDEHAHEAREPRDGGDAAHADRGPRDRSASRLPPSRFWRHDAPDAGLTTGAAAAAPTRPSRSRSARRCRCRSSSSASTAATRPCTSSMSSTVDTSRDSIWSSRTDARAAPRFGAVAGIVARRRTRPPPRSAVWRGRGRARTRPSRSVPAKSLSSPVITSTSEHVRGNVSNGDASPSVTLRKPAFSSAVERDRSRAWPAGRRGGRRRRPVVLRRRRRCAFGRRRGRRRRGRAVASSVGVRAPCASRSREEVERRVHASPVALPCKFSADCSDPGARVRCRAATSLRATAPPEHRRRPRATRFGLLHDAAVDAAARQRSRPTARRAGRRLRTGPRASMYCWSCLFCCESVLLAAFRVVVLAPARC